jgi:hypothetical protein
MKSICVDVYSYYYEWDGKRLRLIDSVVVESTSQKRPRAAT